MQETSLLSRHRDHWSALFGHDWMSETPSIIFTEIDESELKEERGDTEWLINRNGKNALHSFIRKNRLITAYPSVEPIHFEEFNLLQVDEWSPSSIEHTVHLEHNGMPLRTFCKNVWEMAEGCELGPIKLGLSGLVYRLTPSTSKKGSIKNVDGRNDDLTSYEFEGGILRNVEKAESFYHLGWFADLDILGSEFPPIRIWIHKKNAHSAPVEGDVYEGEFWLQSCLFTEK